MAPPSKTNFRIEPKVCQEIPGRIQQLLDHHVVHSAWTPEIETRFVKQYIEALDPLKTKLLFSDVETMRQKLKGILRNLEKGNCSDIETIRDILLERLKENEAFARQYLGPEYQYDDTVSIQTDEEKMEYPKSKEEKKEALRKKLHFRIANYLTTGVPLQEARNNLIHRYELSVKYFLDDDLEEVLDQFLDSFALSLDPHSTYFSPEELENFRIESSLSLIGIGVTLQSRDGFATVYEIFPGGSADRAGALQIKDKIIAVGEMDKPFIPTIDMPLNEVVRSIRGQEGTTVRLVLLRKEGEITRRLTVSIVREKVDLKQKAAAFRIEERTVKKKKFRIGILELPSFYGSPASVEGRSSSEDVKALLKKGREENLDGLVFDLSQNPGGSLDESITMTGLFIQRGPVVGAIYPRQSAELHVGIDANPSTEYSGPLLVLGSRRSASAAEIFAGALKSYKRALIVGSDHTFGKGTIQEIRGLEGPAHRAYKVTSGLFFIPDGQSTQHQGVQGDILIPSLWDRDEIGEKHLQNSLPPFETPPFLGDEANSQEQSRRWIPITQEQIAILRKRSGKRVARSKEFQKISNELKKIRKDAGVVRLADLRKEIEENQKSGADENQPQTEKKEARPEINEAVSILIDLIQLQR